MATPVHLAYNDLVLTDGCIYQYVEKVKRTWVVICG